MKVQRIEYLTHVDNVPSEVALVIEMVNSYDKSKFQSMKGPGVIKDVLANQEKLTKSLDIPVTTAAKIKKLSEFADTYIAVKKAMPKTSKSDIWGEGNIMMRGNVPVITDPYYNESGSFSINSPGEMTMESQVITEGMIKLPSGLLEKSWEFVILDVLRYCYAGLEHVEHASETNILKAESLLIAVGDKWGDVEDFPPRMVHAQLNSKDFPIEVPESYLKRYAELRGKRETKGLLNKRVQVSVVYYAGAMKGFGRSSGKFFTDGNIVAVSPLAFSLGPEGIISIVQHHKDTASQKRTLETLIEQLRGTLEHELTHMIQWNVLGDLHGDQIAHTAPDDEVHAESDEARDIYLMSPIEFDPWIKTDISKVKALLKKHSTLSDAEQRAMIKKFMSADMTITQAHAYERKNDPERSDFFLALRRHDQKKWKLAASRVLQGLEQKPLKELKYPGNIGMMEMMKFYRVATIEQKTKMKKLLADDKTDEAWEFLQQVTGEKLL